VAGELKQISNGVGYTQPFEIVGMPGIDGEQLAAKLQKHAGQGIVIRAIRFKPFYATHQGTPCQGVQIHVDPKRTGGLIDWNYRILEALDAPKLLADAPKRHAMFDKVNGGDDMRKALESGGDIAVVLDKWRAYSDEFREMRKKWLLY